MSGGGREAERWCCGTCAWYRPSSPGSAQGRCGLAVVKYPVPGDGRLGITVTDARTEFCSSWARREGPAR